jgi:membrane protein DedA with SNARE-associated domain
MGAMVAPQTVYALGAQWYATRLDYGWERADATQATAMFARHGLVGPFWALK